MNETFANVIGLLAGPGYGHVLPWNAQLALWDKVVVDLIGLLKLNVHGQELIFNALTCIDPVTNLTELIWIANKSSAHVAMHFENEWLWCYPRPLWCIHDQGPEFMGVDFQRILLLNGIKDVAIIIKNPQANAMCEPMHQTVTNFLCPLLHAPFLQTAQAANDIIDTALATASHASCSMLHHSLNNSPPGALFFIVNMFVDIPLIADLEMICNHHQLLIDENLHWQNLKWQMFDYQVGQQVLLLNLDKHPGKLDTTSTEGPFVIIQVHTSESGLNHACLVTT